MGDICSWAQAEATSGTAATTGQANTGAWEGPKEAHPCLFQVLQVEQTLQSLQECDVLTGDNFSSSHVALLTMEPLTPWGWAPGAEILHHDWPRQ